MKRIVWSVLAVALAVALLAVGAYYIAIPMYRYNEAGALLESGEYLAAAALYAKLGDFKDSAEKLMLCRYNEADRLEQEGRNAAAAMAFGALGDYSDARTRSFSLWDGIAVRSTYAVDSYDMLAIREDGSVMGQTRRNDTYEAIDLTGWTDIVDVAVGRDEYAAVRADGTVLTGENDEDVAAWTDIVAIDYYGSLLEGNTLVGLRSDGTVMYKASVYLFENQRGQDNVSAWRNIVDVKCTNDHTVGLRANGTVIAAGSNDSGECNVDDWNDIVAIHVEAGMTFGLKADGTVVTTYEGAYHAGEYDAAASWTDLVDIGISLDGIIGLRADGTVLYDGKTSDGQDGCLNWTDVVDVQGHYSAPFALKQDGTLLQTTTLAWYEGLKEWSGIRLPARTGFYDHDASIVVNVEAEKNQSTQSFHNAYGTPTTVCAHSGCNNYIANWGDSNCCLIHSNRCGNCGCPIDEDAMYCMECLEEYLG